MYNRTNYYRNGELMEEIIDKLIKLIDEKKGEDIFVVDVDETSNFAKYIFVVTVNSLVHSKSLGKYIVDFFIENDLKKFLYNKHIETSNPWVLIDGGNIIVHLFMSDTRENYGLEKLYFKGNVVYPKK